MKRKTLVIGASSKPNRYSYVAIQRLVDNKEDVIAIGKKNGEVKGIKIETEKIPFTNIHTINLYLNKKNQEEFYDYIVSLKPNRVIFNPGTENEELESILSENNINFERSCTLVLLSIEEY